MTRTSKTAMGLIAASLLAGAVVLLNDRARFILGGAMVNLGYRFQDDLHEFDLMHHQELTPNEVWAEFERQNLLASSVRNRFPRSTNHPLVAMLVCMDARIDTAELAGDTRRYYYVVRTAGSVLGPVEQEMLELAVVNGVKVLVLTTHTDCAAEKAAADPTKRADFPHLTQAVDAREQQIEEFLRRPTIAAKVAAGELVIKRVEIDTHTDRLML